MADGSCTPGSRFNLICQEAQDVSDSCHGGTLGLKKSNYETIMALIDYDNLRTENINHWNWDGSHTLVL